MARFEVFAPRSSPDLDLGRRAEEVLAAGGVLAHPTETVYGIGGAVRADVDAIVADLKQRDPRHRIVRIAASAAILQSCFPDLRWTTVANRLASGFWPGPLTLVLAGESGAGTAVRAEGHQLTREVLRVWAAPIGSTSLNRAGQAPAATLDQAIEVLDGMPDVPVPVLLVDGGELLGGPPSTLLSLVGPEPALLREGAVSRQALEDCLGTRIET